MLITLQLIAHSPKVGDYVLVKGAKTNSSHMPRIRKESEAVLIEALEKIAGPNKPKPQ